MSDEQHTPCPACFQGYRMDGTPKGTMEKLGGLEYYYSPGKPDQKDKAIVIGVDMFGFGVPNCKIIADWFAEKTGWPVFVPDLLEGDHIDPASLGSNLDALEEPMAKKPFLTRMAITLGAVWTFGYKIGPRFLARHSMGHVVPLAEKFCHDLEKEKGFKSLGYVGYCFGGTVSVFLAKADSAVDALVCFHPGGPKPAEWANIAKPFLLVLPEEDFAFDRSKSTVLPMLEKVPVETKVIDDNPGTTHGFGCRPNMAKPQIRQAFERGLEHTKDWFEAHL
ncbi:hypothetical protein BMF94_4634 [Rhodotorula taiwanensis]|uniref:Dienelactone hydrolase domain-containing protein n=1 Tax=Rhodotorula taiwanensis TaxID=741276 RepID=A0A2S5B6C2_9BASI|nr:hypothetical protein BMF94_4634 [Rhodotorula taiwanensis]